MYLRTTRRRNSDGSEVRYLALAHNEWDPIAGRSKVRILFNFGREDELDPAAIRRLIGSLARALPAGEALAATAPAELAFLESRPMGGAWALDSMWSRLGLHQILGRLLRGRRLDPSAERALFAMVANRALAPASKLSCAAWASERVAIPGLAELSDDACYRAMDWLLAVEAELAEQVYWSVANLLNLEVDLLFFDTTSTYFETDAADPPSEGAPAGFRTFGHSKDHRPDLPQVVIGLAVTREGIPIRVWTLPGNTADQALIRSVKDDLRGLEARTGRLGDRPGLRLGGEPALPPARRRPLHQRREAALRERRGEGGPCAPGSLPGRRRQPAGQGSRPRRRGDARPLRRLPQPR